MLATPIQNGVPRSRSTNPQQKYGRIPGGGNESLTKNEEGQLRHRSASKNRPAHAYTLPLFNSFSRPLAACYLSPTHCIVRRHKAAPRAWFRLPNYLCHAARKHTSSLNQSSQHTLPLRKKLRCAKDSYVPSPVVTTGDVHSAPGTFPTNTSACPPTCSESSAAPF